MKEITITKDNFKSEVLNSNIPVLVDFWASWCGPCRMLGPIISEIADEYDGRIKVGKINVDEEEELATIFKVSSIPTVMVFKDCKVIASTVGYQPKNKLLSLLNI